MTKLYRIIITTCLLGAFAFTAQAQVSQKLQGKILSAETKEPVPYAAIGFPEKGLGTVCDENGNFELKIPNGYKNLEICMSALGFKQNCRPVAGFSAANPTVLLEPANLELATVEIKALSATELVKEAIRRIPENYADRPVRYTFYQRQIEIKNGRPAYIIESVNEAWRNHPGNDFQLLIHKSRGIATSKYNKEEMGKQRIVAYTILSHDNIHNRSDFLHPSKFKKFDFQIIEENLIGNDTVYVIIYKPRSKNNGKEISGLEGKLFIHKRSFGILRIEENPNTAAIAQENKGLTAKVINKECDCIAEYQGYKKLTNYKRIGNRYYLDNSISETFHQNSGSNYSKPERFHSFTQLVVTDLQLNNPSEIPKDKQASLFRNYYSSAPKDMNEEFWQQYNVLPLPEAYKNAQEKTVGL